MKSGRSSGYTLVEAILSAAVLGIVAAGVSSVTMMTSRVAYGNIYENTAYNIAQAYAEQVKSISYGTIRNALADPVAYSIPTESLTLGVSESVGDINIDDPLTFGVPMEKEVVIDIEEQPDGSLKERTMTLWVLAQGRDLELETNCWDAVEITIDFAWEIMDGTGLTRKSGEIKLLKTSISE